MLALLLVGVASRAMPASMVPGGQPQAASFPAAVRAVATAAVRPAAPLPGTRRTVLHWLAAGVRRELVEVAPAHVWRALPLVVVLHGRRQTPWRAESVQGWDVLAATSRAVVVYGAGYAGSWNAGRCCGRAAAQSIDDDGYLLHLLRAEEHRRRIDRHRVFLVGFSNGGMLAYRFACTHSTAISAFAVVAGVRETPTCRPQRPLALLDVQGLRDRVVPYAGSRFSRVAGAPTLSVLASLQSWQRIARGPGQVALVRLRGVGHEWPTRRLGCDATAGIWRFLMAHPAPTSR
jgi:polyhydroxybutyrate depolymerase